MQSIAEQFGLPDFIPDGKIHRYGSGRKSNWYVGYQNFARKTGEKFFVLVIGDWSTGEVATHCTLTGKICKEDKDAIEKAIEEARQKAERERKIQWEKAAIEAAKAWNGASDVGSTSYVTQKQMCGSLGIRFRGGDIIVPVRDVDGKLWSIQKIQEDSGKYFYPGARVEACFHTLGEIKNEIYLCEGLATGASIYAATGKPVVVAFNSGNLPKVARAIKNKYKETAIIVAGDEDLWSKDSKNPGREKAEEAAKACYGKSVFPRFKDLQDNPTDFNDVHIREGIEEVKRQLQEVKVEKSFIIPLGFRGSEYFFTSSSNKQISSLTGFTETDLLKLMPVEYWEAVYPNRKDGIDWRLAKSELALACRKRGLFEPRNVRGSGVWNDSGRVVVNLGDYLLVDGEPTPLDQVESRYFYTLGRRLPPINKTPLPLEECEKIREACNKFKWVNNEHGILLAGALITAKICGALPIRPHVWITGSAYTGKSTLLERLVHPVLQDRCFFLQGGTSEPGLRQAIGADAVPIIFDEFETTGKKSSDTVQAIVELMRSTWSEGHGVIAKGSSGGTASFFHPRFSGIVSSIRTNLTNDADKSRFAILELAPHGNDEDHWIELDSMLREIDQDYIDRLFARSLKMLPIILENFKKLKKGFSQKVTTRFGDHYGMLLAGASILLSDKVLVEEEVASVISGMEMPHERSEASTSDHMDCLGHLYGTRAIGLDHNAFVIGEAIQELRLAPGHKLQKDLQTLGIRVDSEFVFIASNHPELRGSVFRNTRWENSWAQSLTRLSGAERNVSTRISGKVSKSVRIPITHFL